MTTCSNPLSSLNCWRAFAACCAATTSNCNPVPCGSPTLSWTRAATAPIAPGNADLTAKEFALLHLLMRQTGEVLSRTQIISLVWDMNFDCDTNVVEVSIRRLRAKIDDPFDTKLIHTLRGVGYVLEARF